MKRGNSDDDDLEGDDDYDNSDDEDLDDDPISVLSRPQAGPWRVAWDYGPWWAAAGAARAKGLNHPSSRCR